MRGCPDGAPLFAQAPVYGACIDTYNLGEFTVGGHEIYCRCGNGGDLFLCDGCPRALCSGCMERNLGASYVARGGRAAAWLCFGAGPPSSRRRPERRWQAIFDGAAARARGLGPGGALPRAAPRGRGGRGGPEGGARRTPTRGARVAGRGAGRAAARGARLEVVLKDMSGGIERVPIRFVGDERPLPSRSYTRKNISYDKFDLNADPDFLACCDCTDGCRDATKCACVRRTGPSRVTDARRVDWAPTGPRSTGAARAACHADAKTCPNRVVGNGLTLPLEVFVRPQGGGWGVRSAAHRRRPVRRLLLRRALTAEADARGATRGDDLFNMDATRSTRAGADEQTGPPLECHGPEHHHRSPSERPDAGGPGERRLSNPPRRRRPSRGTPTTWAPARSVDAGRVAGSPGRRARTTSTSPSASTPSGTAASAATSTTAASQTWPSRWSSSTPRSASRPSLGGRLWDIPPKTGSRARREDQPGDSRTLTATAAPRRRGRLY